MKEIKKGIVTQAFINSIGVYKKHWTLFLLIGLVYLGAIGTGYLMYGFEPARSIMEDSWASQKGAIEQYPVIKWIEEQIRKGRTINIIGAGLAIFLHNLILADFMFKTLPGLLIVLPPIVLFYTGWLQGLAFAAEGGIPPLEVSFCYLEFFTYYLAAVAGTNIGLSILFPKRYNTDSRWVSFKSAWKEAGYIYIWITIILLIAGVWEAYYVYISKFA